MNFLRCERKIFAIGGRAGRHGDGSINAEMSLPGAPGGGGAAEAPGSQVNKPPSCRRRTHASLFAGREAGGVASFSLGLGNSPGMAGADRQEKRKSAPARNGKKQNKNGTGEKHNTQSIRKEIDGLSDCTPRWKSVRHVD